MTDHEKKIVARIKLMLGHVERTLDMDEPDFVVVEKLMGDTLDLVIALQNPDPPNPYADPALRPALRVPNPGVPVTDPPQENPDV
jgi:hypothetical protein